MHNVGDFCWPPENNLECEDFSSHWIGKLDISVESWNACTHLVRKPNRNGLGKYLTMSMFYESHLIIQSARALDFNLQIRFNTVFSPTCQNSSQKYKIWTKSSLLPEGVWIHSSLFYNSSSNIRLCNTLGH